MRWPWEQARESLAKELEAHLQLAIADRVAAGEDPAHARQAALREFGNPPLIEDVIRERWVSVWLETLRSE